jgi:hypothetical protein
MTRQSLIWRHSRARNMGFGRKMVELLNIKKADTPLKESMGFWKNVTFPLIDFSSSYYLNKNNMKQVFIYITNNLIPIMLHDHVDVVDVEFKHYRFTRVEKRTKKLLDDYRVVVIREAVVRFDDLLEVLVSGFVEVVSCLDHIRNIFI